MMKRLTDHLEDFLALLGCLCILYGLSRWNVILAWIAAGIMLIVFSLVIAKEKAKHVVPE